MRGNCVAPAGIKARNGGREWCQAGTVELAGASVKACDAVTWMGGGQVRLVDNGNLGCLP